MATTPENPHKQIILALIKDDIVNTNLISGLRDLGLDAGDYMLHIPEAIIQLMGFEDSERTDQVYDAYFDLIQQITPRPADQLKLALDQSAEQIYKTLYQFKFP